MLRPRHCYSGQKGRKGIGWGCCLSTPIYVMVAGYVHKAVFDDERCDHCITVHTPGTAVVAAHNDESRGCTQTEIWVNGWTEVMWTPSRRHPDGTSFVLRRLHWRQQSQPHISCRTLPIGQGRFMPSCTDSTNLNAKVPVLYTWWRTASPHPHCGLALQPELTQDSGHSPRFSTAHLWRIPASWKLHLHTYDG